MGISRRHLVDLEAEFAELAGLITRQGDDLAQAQLHRANLAAAARAGIAATREGEVDARRESELSYSAHRVRKAKEVVVLSDSIGDVGVGWPRTQGDKEQP